MKNPWVITIVGLAILFGGAIWYSSASIAKNNEGVSTIENIKGNAEATVVLQEYSDFQCPACQAFTPVVDEVLSQYGEQIRFEYKHYPLPIHPYAVQAAVAAEAAGQQGKFFEYHDLLFVNQANWSNSRTPAALFLTYADELGLDMDMFKRHMNSSVLKDKVAAEVAEGRTLGITGTPTFILNGQQMQIATYEDFVNQVAAAVNPVATDGTVEATSSEAGEVRFGL